MRIRYTHTSNASMCAFFIIYDVIANQSEDWCGNPHEIPVFSGDSHASVRTGSE